MSVVLEYLDKAVEKGGRIIHMKTNCPARYRVGQDFVEDEEGLIGLAEMENSVRVILGQDRKRELEDQGETVSLVHSRQGHRFRIAVYSQRGTFGLVARYLPRAIPELASLGLPSLGEALQQWGRGLFLLTGRPGSGRTATAACLLQELVGRTCLRVVTLEDPVLFRLDPRGSLVAQREVGRDTANFDSGIEAARHQDLDILFCQQLPHPQAFESLLELADSGVLVMTIVDAHSTVEALAQLLDEFPVHRQGQVADRLTRTLRGVLAQVPVPEAEDRPPRSVFELFTLTRPAWDPLRLQDFDALRAGLDRWKGCLSFERSLEAMRERGRVTSEEAEAVLAQLS